MLPDNTHSMAAWPVAERAKVVVFLVWGGRVRERSAKNRVTFNAKRENFGCVFLQIIGVTWKMYWTPALTSSMTCKDDISDIVLPAFHSITYVSSGKVLLTTMIPFPTSDQSKSTYQSATMLRFLACVLLFSTGKYLEFIAWDFIFIRRYYLHSCRLQECHRP